MIRDDVDPPSWFTTGPAWDASAKSKSTPPTSTTTATGARPAPVAGAGWRLFGKTTSSWKKVPSLQIVAFFSFSRFWFFHPLICYYYRLLQTTTRSLRSPHPDGPSRNSATASSSASNQFTASSVLICRRLNTPYLVTDLRRFFLSPD